MTTMTGRKRGGTSTRTLTPLPPTNSPPLLPFDLVAEILCCLPVKHLLQLRCVCKSWNSLISHDSKFAKNHLRLSTSNHDRHDLILVSASLFYLSGCPISSIFSSAASFTSFKWLNNHRLILNLKGDYIGRVTTCDGMVCVRIDESLAFLCNPSIRKFKILPPLINPSQKYLQTSFTLVYDRFTSNYKIIALSVRDYQKNREINVHTLGTDYWKGIHDFPNHHLIQGPGIFLSDSLHWLPYDGRSGSSGKVIVSLHLQKESYQEFSHPLYDIQSETYNTLGVLRDCLCIFSNSDKFFDVWIMKEYGNGQSWTKLLSVPQMGDAYIYILTKPLYISEHDQVLMYFMKRRKFSLAVYDSINDTYKIPEIQGNIQVPMEGRFYFPYVYIESLISPFFQD
ncbi:F-box/kelch-repeat protein At3g23880 [Medicago truncatula]|nr:F-box/kelch-repeat protein At3g23880 [Medicago truncatula]